MAESIPRGQQFVDLKNGEQIGITRVVAPSASFHVKLPNPIKTVTVLGATKAETNALGFYTGGGSKPNVFNVDNATAGQELVIVSRHGGMVNFGSE